METAKAYIVKPDNTTEDVTPKNGKRFTIEELYELVDTDTIEVLYLPSGDKMIVDEDGKPKGKPHNALATAFYQKDKVVGTVVICKSKMFN